MPVQPRTLSPAPLFNTFSFSVSLSSFCASVSRHFFSVCLSLCPGCCLSIFLCGSSPHLSVSSHTPFLSSLFSCLSLSSLPPSLFPSPWTHIGSHFPLETWSRHRCTDATSMSVLQTGGHPVGAFVNINMSKQNEPQGWEASVLGGGMIGYIFFNFYLSFCTFYLRMYVHTHMLVTEFNTTRKRPPDSI